MRAPSPGAFTLPVVAVVASRVTTPPSGRGVVRRLHLQCGHTARAMLARPVPERAGCMSCWLDGVRRGQRRGVSPAAAIPEMG